MSNLIENLLENIMQVDSAHYEVAFVLYLMCFWLSALKVKSALHGVHPIFLLTWTGSCLTIAPACQVLVGFNWQLGRA